MNDKLWRTLGKSLGSACVQGIVRYGGRITVTVRNYKDAEKLRRALVLHGKVFYDKQDSNDFWLDCADEGCYNIRIVWSETVNRKTPFSERTEYGEQV